MFTEYFTKQSRRLQDALKKALHEQEKKSSSKKRDLRLYNELYSFLREHLPRKFALATGKVRSRERVLNKYCDALIYDGWCQRYLDMTGGYILCENLYAFINIEQDLSTKALISHVDMTRTLKKLYIGLEKDEIPEEMKPQKPTPIPMFSLLFAYKSDVPLLSHRKALNDAAQEKKILPEFETDLICVLGKGLIIKDWENNGAYKTLETGEDTLMWFYILLLEYLERDGPGAIHAREYIQNTKDYVEY